ncbi:MAG TPA: hypothetical protein VMJ10_03065, partial [Kofleriaceae bacterium]|nr:hypothetical protein [Kofleriaceae bacterium]
LIDGTTLADWVRAEKRPQTEIVASFVAAGRGLAAAHAAGLVHRDFKPHNVLRARDGRVLVTDFGLARGIAGVEPDPAAVEATLPASPAGDAALDATVQVAARRSDNVLESPLTRTGALVGTPAYMAPEQYAGASPDPRTDQFAYCVTAWQALAGERPFRGATLDELKRSVESGIERVTAKLPHQVRAVLARGLARDPAKRWPDLAALLAALERATRTRVRWPYAAAVLAVAAAAAIVFVTRSHADVPPPPSPCRPAEVELADAWPAGVREKLAASPQIEKAFEDWQDKWTRSYAGTCQDPGAQHFQARVDCMLGVRDSAATVAQLFANHPEAFDPAMIPTLGVCEGPSPVGPPSLPREQPLRSKIFAVAAELAAMHRARGDELEKRYEQIKAEAEQLGWKPLQGYVELAAATTYLRLLDPDDARKHFDQAFAIATGVHDVLSVADVWIGQLEASEQELAHPGWSDDVRVVDALPEEITRLRSYAEGAVHAAGDEPVHAAQLKLLEADIAAAHAHSVATGKPFKKAIELAVEARRLFDSLGDSRRLAAAAIREAEFELRRNDEHALDDATTVTRTAAEALKAAHAEVPAELAALRGQIAFEAGDLKNAHKHVDHIVSHEPRTPPGVERSGKVLDKTGAPVAGATVVAWTGDLEGDPVRAYRDARLVDGDIATSAADGTFAIHAVPGAAILAEAPDGRATPRLVGEGAIVIKLAKTTAVAGAIEAANPRQLDAFVRYRAGDATWTVRMPVGSDRSYSLVNLPPGASPPGLIATAGDGERTISPGQGQQLRWPSGVRIDVIVRVYGGNYEPATVLIVRGHVVAKTPRELEAASAHASDIAIAKVHPVGADASTAGRDYYQHGDRHAIIDGNADGEVTACALTSARVACKSMTARVGKVVVNADGSTVTDTLAVLLEL